MIEGKFNKTEDFKSNEGENGLVDLINRQFQKMTTQMEKLKE